jgi:hypothetical protein
MAVVFGDKCTSAYRIGKFKLSTTRLDLLVSAKNQAGSVLKDVRADVEKLDNTAKKISGGFGAALGVARSTI